MSSSSQERIEQIIRRILVEQHRTPPEPGAPLDVDSLTVVALVDALETELGARFRPSDVSAENFESLDALVRVCLERLP